MKTLLISITVFALVTASFAMDAPPLPQEYSESSVQALPLEYAEPSIEGQLLIQLLTKDEIRQNVDQIKENLKAIGEMMVNGCHCNTPSTEDFGTLGNHIVALKEISSSLTERVSQSDKEIFTPLIAKASLSLITIEKVIDDGSNQISIDIGRFFEAKEACEVFIDIFSNI